MSLFSQFAVMETKASVIQFFILTSLLCFLYSKTMLTQCTLVKDCDGMFNN